MNDTLRKVVDLCIDKKEIYNIKNKQIKGQQELNTKFYEYTIIFQEISYRFILTTYTKNEKELCSIFLENINKTIFSESDDIINIHVEDKTYCIELLDKFIKDKDKIEVTINFIQNRDYCNLPAVKDIKCVGLNGIFGLIYELLFEKLNLDSTTKLYLEDDSQISFGLNYTFYTYMHRVMLGKNSIYESYGFHPIDNNYTPINFDNEKDVIMKFIPKNDIYIGKSLYKGKSLYEITKEKFDKIQPYNVEDYIKFIKTLLEDTTKFGNDKLIKDYKIFFPKEEKIETITIKQIFNLIRKKLSHMECSDLTQLRKLCKPQTAGSIINYKNKYLKYKFKYLQLKNRK